MAAMHAVEIADCDGAAEKRGRKIVEGMKDIHAINEAETDFPPQNAR